MRAEYEGKLRFREKKNSYYVTKYVEKSKSVHLRFQIFAQSNQFSKIILFHFVDSTTLDRLKTIMYSLCTSKALLSQNYRSHVSSTLYKPDTSVGRTVKLGPDGVRLRESSLYCAQESTWYFRWLIRDLCSSRVTTLQFDLLTKILLLYVVVPELLID